jgi:Fic family protein
VDEAAFTPAASGELARTVEGALAFIPSPAPRAVQLSDAVIALLDEASNGLGLLAGIGRRLPSPHLLIAPYLRREAVLSSRIEGTVTSLSDIYALEAEQLALIEAPDVEEVRNYVMAYEYGLGRLETLPLSLRFIRELHERLMAAVRGGVLGPGTFRTYQNWIGGATARDAIYVPPPPPQMQVCLDDFERFLHDRTLRPLVQAAVLHYQFEAIHPFGDGNGRVGRLLVLLFLAERGLLPEPLLYLSAFFERTRSTYYDLLLRVSTHGDWDSWLRYFLEAVRSQARDAADRADRLLALQAELRDDLRKTRVTATALALVDHLFENPIVSASSVQRAFGVSAPTARTAIQTLERAGIVREITGRRWGKAYEADRILELLRADEPA